MFYNDTFQIGIPTLTAAPLSCFYNYNMKWLTALHTGCLEKCKIKKTPHPRKSYSVSNSNLKYSIFEYQSGFQ